MALLSMTEAGPVLPGEGLVTWKNGDYGDSELRSRLLLRLRSGRSTLSSLGRNLATRAGFGHSR